LARQLLKKGNPIVDIKPDKERDGHTIFIFETTEKFKKDLSTLLSE
jgi:translation initiation factor 1 (eIF-1/SUI1)